MPSPFFLVEIIFFNLFKQILRLENTFTQSERISVFPPQNLTLLQSIKNVFRLRSYSEYASIALVIMLLIVIYCRCVLF